MPSADVEVLKALFQRLEAEQLQAREERVAMRVQLVALATKMAIGAVVASAAVGGAVSWLVAR